MGNYISVYGLKRFPGVVVTAQNTRKRKHEKCKKTLFIILITTTTKKNYEKRT